MTAQVIDADENVNNEEEFASVEDLNGDDVSNVEEVENEQVQEPASEEPEQSDLPDKYQGKSIQEIAQMHQEAEKLLGRHSSEVGELRKVVDDFIRANLDNNSPQEPEEEVDYWDDPKKAVEKSIENHPAIKKFEETSKRMSEQEVLNKLNTHYPDWEDTVNDKAFADWVTKSNKRMQMFAEAQNNYDWEAADELLGTWGELTKTKKEAQKTAKADTDQQIKNAATGTSKGADAKPSKKIYRRLDIINLMQNDPKRYQQLADEITRAYAEGRVK